jgi:hypothetical protein
MTATTCDCPAYTADQVGWHTPDDHAWDCGTTDPDRVCGTCWGCTAARIAYHQVLASRGTA